MRIMLPKPITADRIISCNLAEDEHPVYDADALYLAGSRVIQDHRIYQALVGDAVDDIAPWTSTAYTAGQQCYVEETHRIYQCNSDSDGQYPPNYATGSSPVWTAVGWVNRGIVVTDPTYWRDCGPTNLYAQFDNYTSTQSVGVPLDGGGYGIDTVLASSRCNAVALFNVVGAYVDISCMSRTGVVYWSKRIRLAQRGARSLFRYFFGPFKIRSDIYQQFPMAFGARLQVTVYGNTMAKCGDTIVGSTLYAGDVKLGTRLESLDYSKINTDDFGVVTFSQGLRRKKVVSDIWVDNVNMDYANRLFDSLSGVPAVYVCDNSERGGRQYESMLVKGLKTKWSVVVDHITWSDCSLEVEGL